MNFQKKQKGFTPTPKCLVCQDEGSECKIQKANNLNVQSAKQRVKGFTFIELMIAVFLCALIMVAVAAIFSSSISGYQKARNVQKNLEDAQFIMNQMAKILRTSSIINFSSPNKSILVYDYSSNKCYVYKFYPETVGGIKVDSMDVPTENKEPLIFCSNGSFSPDVTPMAALYVEDGHFDVIKSEPGDSDTNGVLGKVTISMSICQNASSCSKDRARVQTSVSLRDYYNAGI